MVENAWWLAPLATFGSVYLAVLAFMWPNRVPDPQTVKANRPRGRHGFIAG